jgi:hypothetical protein
MTRSRGKSIRRVLGQENGDWTTMWSNLPLKWVKTRHDSDPLTKPSPQEKAVRERTQKGSGRPHPRPADHFCSRTRQNASSAVSTWHVDPSPAEPEAAHHKKRAAGQYKGRPARFGVGTSQKRPPGPLRGRPAQYSTDSTISSRERKLRDTWKHGRPSPRRFAGKLGRPATPMAGRTLLPPIRVRLGSTVNYRTRVRSRTELRVGWPPKVAARPPTWPAGHVSWPNRLSFTDLAWLYKEAPSHGSNTHSTS